MNPRTLQILAGALGVQALLAAATWWPRGAAVTGDVPLVTVPRDQVTRLVISGAPGDDGAPTASVRLERQGDTWVLPDLGNYPAKADKVSEVLDDVVGIVARTPIARQATSHSSLAVDAAGYGKKVELGDGTTTTTLLLGAASGQSVNVRVDGQDDVYAARGFSLWSLADSARSYYDTELLTVPTDDLESLTVRNAAGAVTLTRGPTGWSVAGVPPETPLDTNAIDGVVRKLATVRMTEPVGIEARPEYGLEGGVRVEWSVTTDGASVPGALSIGAATGSERYLRVDGKPYVVKVSSATFDPLTTLTVADLVRAE
jgi:hypothetical protein